MMNQSFVDWPEVWPRSALSAIASSLPAWTSASNWRSQASASNAAYQERNAVSSAGESFSICCSIASTLLMDHLARKYTSLDSRCQPLQMISATRREMVSLFPSGLHKSILCLLAKFFSYSAHRLHSLVRPRSSCTTNPFGFPFLGEILQDTTLLR